MQVIRRHPRYDRAYTNLAGTLYVKGKAAEPRAGRLMGFPI